MILRAVLVLAALLAPPTAGLVPQLAAAEFTVVLRDGRRIAAREKYVIESGMVTFVGADGQAYRFSFGEVSFLATAKLNRRKRNVWTNDEIERMRSARKINVVGSSVAAPASAQPAQAVPAGAKPAGAKAAGGEGAEGEEAEGEEKPAAEKPKPLPPREQDPAYYRDRLKPLRDDLAKVERDISALQRNLQAGGAGATGVGMGLGQASGGTDPRDTLQRLQNRRDDLRRQIASIEDEARRKGISAGQLR